MLPLSKRRRAQHRGMHFRSGTNLKDDTASRKLEESSGTRSSADGGANVVSSVKREGIVAERES